MDESLSDFQEKKITFNGPKKKKPSKTNKVKRDIKFKGQKDIRTLVKSRNNALLKYTKDFDQACRNTGLDVDSEQLQIAIALSKSLQENQPQPEEFRDDTKPLTAKERTRKIKLTLQEYGFKVPNAVVQKKNRRVKNINSKLINTSESDKSKLISSKYLKILERNPILSTYGPVNCDQSDKDIYHKTTNILYSNIKTVDEFYVPDLIEKTTHKTCLLRDWSEIPGRPHSPVVEVTGFKFDEVSFSQQELDCILSRPLKEVHEVIKNKSAKMYEEKVIKIDEVVDTNLASEVKINNMEICNIKDNDSHAKLTTQKDRSQSPDLFDEDDYPTTVHSKDQTQILELKSNSGLDKTSFMDLTECIGNMNNIQNTIIAFKSSKISEDPNSIETKFNTETSSQYLSLKLSTQSKTLCCDTDRELNDFMEVTDCVASEFNYNDNYVVPNEVISKSLCLEEAVDVDMYLLNNQSEKVNKPKPTKLNTENFENIDLTQACDDSIICVNNGDLLSFEDLTQSSNSNDDFPIIKLSTLKDESSDDTVILQDHDTSTNVFKEKSILSDGDLLHNTSLIDNVHVNNESRSGITIRHANSNSNMVKEESDKVCIDTIVFEINEHIDSPTNIIIENKNGTSINVSNICNDNKILCEDKIDLTQSLEIQSMNEDKTDLTQITQSPNTSYSVESLGKQNNVSIDYDELYDNMMIVLPSTMKYQEDLIIDNEDKIIEAIGHDNYHSPIKNNYITLNNTKGRNHNKNRSFIGLPQANGENSYIEAITNTSVDVENTSIYTTNRNSSYYPTVEVKKVSKMTVTETSQSPIKISHVNNDSLETPVTDQYIIKTQNITPMLDYESMSTPARNKELDKYGIKPFKRKRAIQLLTYIYNQTHPVVEDCAVDDMPSTSKKFKPNTQIMETDQILNKKIQKSPTDFEQRDVDKENSLYVETKVNPDIKKIECSSDDWVFQVREKAKVHSCRVPLHIALHNYVSCRYKLRTAILQYEPINIDIIHKDLIASGYRYNPKDLLKFLDKKCITVRTTENNARNRKFKKS